MAGEPENQVTSSGMGAPCSQWAHSIRPAHRYSASSWNAVLDHMRRRESTAWTARIASRTRDCTRADAGAACRPTKVRGWGAVRVDRSATRTARALSGIGSGATAPEGGGTGVTCPVGHSSGVLSCTFTADSGSSPLPQSDHAELYHECRTWVSLLQELRR